MTNLFKVSLIGGPSVGKTAFVHTHDTTCYGKQNPSLGTQVRSIPLISETAEKGAMELWDFAAEFPSPHRQFYLRKSDLAIVMYDVTHPDFDYVRTEIDLFREACPGKPILMIGNKVNLLTSDQEVDNALDLLRQFSDKIKQDLSINLDYALCTNKSFSSVHRVIQKAMDHL